MRQAAHIWAERPINADRNAGTQLLKVTVSL